MPRRIGGKWAPEDFHLVGLAHLKADMAEQGLNQEQLADAADMGRATVTQLLAAQAPGSTGAHVAIARVLGRDDPGLYFPRSPGELARAEAALIGFCS